MKVSFKLNSKQLNIAKKIKKEVFLRNQEIAALPQNLDIPFGEWMMDEGGNSVRYRGNMLVSEGHNFSYNPDQYLELDVRKMTIAYSGQRCPFIVDGALDTIATIFETEDFTSLSPSLYCSKGPADMRWYENRHAYLERTLNTPLKKLNFILNDENEVFTSRFDSRSDFYPKLIEMIEEEFEESPNEIKRLKKILSISDKSFNESFGRLSTEADVRNRWHQHIESSVFTRSCLEEGFINTFITMPEEVKTCVATGRLYGPINDTWSIVYYHHRDDRSSGVSIFLNGNSTYERLLLQEPNGRTVDYDFETIEQAINFLSNNEIDATHYASLESEIRKMASEYATFCMNRTKSFESTWCSPVDYFREVTGKEVKLRKRVKFGVECVDFTKEGKPEIERVVQCMKSA